MTSFNPKTSELAKITIPKQTPTDIIRAIVSLRWSAFFANLPPMA
ncbi:hypothetical protein [Spiroplasma endosymbiont of Danaus chrysippus]|nr:hypothetical protein [Spiroplasma endosymbiont of Danaus chrysippus]